MIVIKTRAFSFFKLGLLAILGLLAAVSIVQGFRNGMSFVDFHWESAALFLRGENPYQWFFENRYFQGVWVDATQAPSTIAFILPYGAFSHFVGNLLWDMSNVVFLFLVAWFIFKMWFEDNKVMAFTIAAIFAMGTPYRVCIGNGQHSMISMAFFVATLWAIKNKKSCWWIGLLMAGSLFKYTFAVPLAFMFLYLREWKSIAVCAFIHIFLTVFLGVYVQTNPIDLVVQSMKVGAQLNTSGGDADWAGLASLLGANAVGLYALAGYIFFGILLFVYSFSGKKDELLKLATFSIIANVMFYHRIYDFVTLVFPLVYVIKNWNKENHIDRVVKVMIIVNLVWVFFLQRASQQLGIERLPVGHVLQHVLLLVLLMKSYIPSSRSLYQGAK